LRLIHLITLVTMIPLLVAVPAWSADSTFFDATNSIIDISNPVGTQWHEIWPGFCNAPYTITGWADNGDGILSHCDIISMTNPQGLTECHHVLHVTLTLELTRLVPPDGEPHYWDWDEDRGGDPLTNPVCTWWIEIYPGHGDEFHIQAWEDNQSGELDFCDGIVDDSGAQWHVEGVHTDMVTEPADECATDEASWSRIKALYR
jgi:hypothetical protein